MGTAPRRHADQLPQMAAVQAGEMDMAGLGGAAVRVCRDRGVPGGYGVQAETEVMTMKPSGCCTCICCRADKMNLLVKALEFIRDGYDNHDVNHVDFRVKAFQVATDALASHTIY